MGDLFSYVSASPPLAPIDRQLLVYADGTTLFPHAHMNGAGMRMSVGTGIKVEWQPVSKQALLAIWVGEASTIKDEAIATTLTRPELQQLILELLSIDRQLDAA